MVTPADAQTAAAPAPDQLPAVIVNPPEARPRIRPKSARRERSARNPSAVQTSMPAGPQITNGVTSGSAAAGPAYMQPTAASATTISGAEVNAQPFARPGEALEVVPGLIVTQHSGEGKANQYFLRGFNLDHGTDLAIKVDGMPVNMPTHGHGQGYADINFLIPELIQSVYVRKGPY
jgi:outer membrane receptor for Fe3+-dicitrate